MRLQNSFERMRAERTESDREKAQDTGESEKRDIHYFAS
jgi:hypothetical protein